MNDQEKFTVALVHYEDSFLRDTPLLLSSDAEMRLYLADCRYAIDMAIDKIWDCPFDAPMEILNNLLLKFEYWSWIARTPRQRELFRNGLDALESAIYEEDLESI